MQEETKHSAGPLHGLDRWMYRGGRPNRLARVMNRISALQFSAGLDRHAPLEEFDGIAAWVPVFHLTAN